jgi:DNA-binding transcriptional MerR regulator
VNKDIIEEFYLLTLLDIKEGVSIQELEDIIQLYEDVEDYEACAGILKAINETRHDTITNINEKREDTERD